jgi:hypothetical protein
MTVIMSEPASSDLLTRNAVDSTATRGVHSCSEANWLSSA